ncbi:hypothetical protein [Salinactinospora qingdaonensis]
MNTGPGTQINATFDFEELRSYLDGRLRTQVGARHGNGRIPADEVAQIRRRFARPGGYDGARQKLAKTGILFLCGEPGSGRRGTATQLLGVVGDPTGVGREIRELPDQEEAPYLDETRIHPAELLLLDAATDGGYPLRELQGELSSYRASVAARGAYLVVLVSPDEERALQGRFDSLVAHIQRPEGREVLWRHLADLGITPADTVMAEQETQQWLCSADVREAAHLASLINHARERDGGRGEFHDWLQEARSALQDWDESVAGQIDRCGTSRQRAVLLAAAMFEGCSADRVFYAAEELLPRVATPEDDLPELERQRFSCQLQELDVPLEGRRTRFRKLNYGAAMRNRFWDDFPGLRGRFEEWIDACLRHHELSEAERGLITDRLADQHLRCGSTEELFAMVERWTRQGGQMGEAPFAPRQALQLLGRLLDDEYADHPTRARIREWALEPGLSTPLAEVLIVVCREFLAETYPDQAFVRLRHLARHPRASIANEAKRVIMELAGGDAELRGVLLRILAYRLARRHRQARRIHDADTELLWRVTDPGLPIAGVGDRVSSTQPAHHLLTSAMVAVMAADPAQAGRYARRWLESSAANPRWSAAMLDPMVQAAAEAGCCARLYTAARRWALEAPNPREQFPRRRAAELLTDRVDHSQGFTFDTTHRTDTAEEAAQ